MISASALWIFLSFTSLDARQTQPGLQKDQEEGLTISSIPIVQTVNERGVGIALVDRYHLNPTNKTSSSSSSGFGGFITGNGSWGVGAAQTFYFKEDQWYARAA